MFLRDTNEIPSYRETKVVTKIKGILIGCKFEMEDIGNYKLNNYGLTFIDNILNDPNRKRRAKKKTDAAPVERVSSENHSSSQLREDGISLK